MNPGTAPMHRLGLEKSYVEEQERKSVRPRRMAALVAGVLISVMWALSFLGIQPIPLDLNRIAELSITFLGGARCSMCSKVRAISCVIGWPSIWLSFYCSPLS